VTLTAEARDPAGVRAEEERGGYGRSGRWEWTEEGSDRFRGKCEKNNPDEGARVVG